MPTAMFARHAQRPWVAVAIGASKAHAVAPACFQSGANKAAPQFNLDLVAATHDPNMPTPLGKRLRVGELQSRIEGAPKKYSGDEAGSLGNVTRPRRRKRGADIDNSISQANVCN